MMVVDDFGEGNPVAFMVCNREDEAALSLFFRAIKARIPSDISYSASHVMTDDANQYFNAWCSVFGTAEKKLCTWHVDKNWRKAIKQHIRDPNDQIEVYHMLRSLLQEVNEQDFKNCLESFREYLSRESPQFGAYFESYCSRTEQWAYCYRIGTQSNTNMYVESFHNVLKSCYMERKCNRRVDALISILLRIARDKAFERLIKVEKHSASKKVNEITKRHVILLSDLPATESGGWKIPSASQCNLYYFVVLSTENCTCNMHCGKCRCCPHMYHCSCVDFAVHSTVCKHVHTVHELRRDRGEVHMTDAGSLDEVITPITDVEPMQLDVPVVGATTYSMGTVENMRQRFISECQQLIALASSCDTVEAMACAMTHVKSANASIRAVAKLQTQSLPVCQKMPANKKLDKQLRFYSTKAHRKPANLRLAKPCTEKVSVVKKMLLRGTAGRITSQDCSSSHTPVVGDPLFSAMGYDCVDVPYCVDSEDVIA